MANGRGMCRHARHGLSVTTTAGNPSVTAAKYDAPKKRARCADRTVIRARVTRLSERPPAEGVQPAAFTEPYARRSGWSRESPSLSSETARKSWMDHPGLAGPFALNVRASADRLAGYSLEERRRETANSRSTLVSLSSLAPDAAKDIGKVRVETHRSAHWIEGTPRQEKRNEFPARNSAHFMSILQFSFARNLIQCPLNLFRSPQGLFYHTACHISPLLAI